MLKSRAFKYHVGRYVAKNPNYFITVYLCYSIALICYVLVHISWILALILLPFGFIGLCFLTWYIDKYTTQKEKAEKEMKDLADAISADRFWRRLFGG